MADRWGIEPGYVDGEGRARQVPPSTITTLRQAMGGAEQDSERDDVLEPLVVTAGPDRPVVGAGVISLEDGGEIVSAGPLPDEVPLGYHTLATPSGGRPLIVTPGRCRPPAGRSWGWAVQLYATRSSHSWGIGDLGDLGSLARWSRRLGADSMLVSPLGAAAPTLPQQPSPYFPSSRRFGNPIHLRVEDVPGADAVGADMERLGAVGRALTGPGPIDRDRIWQCKRDALEAIWRARPPPARFESWLATSGADLAQFATWCALAEMYGPRWREWPAAYRRPGSPQLARFASQRSDRVRFFQWLQWLVDEQLAAAARHGVTLIGDLPVGVDPDGADAWAWQDLLAVGATIGAPPDQFNPAGQDWGLPPFVPQRLRAVGYGPFIQTIRAAMAHYGGLRIDHVMGLFRLFWVPAGGGPAEGAYVRYPAEDLLGIIALESHRAGAPVVGEDLGTVEHGVRAALSDHGILTYRVLWFEPDDPATWPPLSMASVTTHDLPTAAGLWSGADLRELEALGAGTDAIGTRSIRERLARTGGLRPDASDEAAVLAAHRLLARSPSAWLCATLEDAVATRARPNLPAVAGRPNWSLPLPASVEELARHSLAARVAAILDAAVRATPHGRPSPEEAP